MITVGDAGAEQQRLRELLDAGVTVPQLMTWHYDSPAVVLGRSQRPSVDQRESALRERVALVSRSSGGGAVMAGPWMLSLTMLLPSSHEIARASLPAGRSWDVFARLSLHQRPIHGQQQVIALQP